MSKVQGGMKCVKYLLFVFNFIFWMSGSLVLAVGLWLRFDPDTANLLAEDDAPENFFIVDCVIEMTNENGCRARFALDCFEKRNHAAVYILIGAGGVMMLVGFFGCFGAVRESQCLLGSFFACLLLIFGAEVAAGVFGLLHKEQIIKDVQNYYESAMRNENGTSTASMYHKVLECCGTESFRPNELCTGGSPDMVFKDCVKAIEEFFNEKLFIIGYVGIGIAGVMIIGMIFSMVLCCAIRNSREVI